MGQYQRDGRPMDENNPANFETTFDVDGHIETTQSPMSPGGKKDLTRGPPDQYGPPGYEPQTIGEDILPCTLEFREEGTCYHHHPHCY